nr:hypothetical protein [Eubacterium sp.]
MKKIALFLTLFLLGFLNVNQAQAYTDSVIQGNYEFEYEYTNGGIWITKITPLADEGISMLKIPAKIEGKKVVKLGPKEPENGEWENEEYEENVFGVRLAPDDADTPCWPMDIYERTKKIKRIRIPETVKEITGMTFIHLQDGKSINIPKGVVKNVTGLTYYKWKKFTISPKNKKYKKVNGCLLSKDGKIVYGLLEERDKVVMPKTVTKMMLGAATAYDDTSTIVLPKGLRKIENDGFQISSKVTIKVAKGNKKYAAKHGCLYNKKTGKLVTGSAPNGVLHIPHGVTYVTGYYVSVGVRYDDTGSHWFGGGTQKMIVPSTVKKLDRILNFFDGPDCEIVMQAKKPPKLSCLLVHQGIKNVAVYVPKGVKAAYEKAWGKKFKEYSSLTVTFIEKKQ